MCTCKLIIDVTNHSIIDLITNSSTEIFVIDTDKTLLAVQEIIKDLENQYPNEYGHGLYVDYVDEYDYQEMYDYIDKNQAIEYLTALGYTITPPLEENQKKLIKILGERGGHDRISQKIYEIFNVVSHDSDR